jgi:hypothetical protein
MRWFEWHDAKLAKNLREHGIHFEVAREVFDNEAADIEVDQFEAEERWIVTGRTRRGVLLVVVHTVWYEEDDEIIRIISARRADSRERRKHDPYA